MNSSPYYFMRKKMNIDKWQIRISEEKFQNDERQIRIEKNTIKYFLYYEKKRWVLTNSRLGFQRKIMGLECGPVDQNEKKLWGLSFNVYIL